MRLLASDYQTALPIFSEAESFTPSSLETTDQFDRRFIPEFALFSSKVALTRLRSFNENWDGFGSQRPNPTAIDRAYPLLESLYRQAVCTTSRWEQPNITASECGEIVFEWWVSARKLTIYLSDDDAYFIRVWGVDIDDEMDDGSLQDIQFAELWTWLHN